MEKSVQISLIVVLGVIVLAGMGYAVFSTLIPTNTVTGNGEAKINAVPDLVGVYFSVETRADTSEEANSQNSEIVEEMKSSLEKEGFGEDRIETINFNIYPEYTWNEHGEQKFKGYVATHSLRVKLSSEEFDKIGKVVDAGVSAGAGINYINFELSQEKQNEYKAQAIKAAAEDARIKAEAMAEGLGQKLGKLVSTSDNNFNYYPWRVYEAAGGVSYDAAEVKTATTSIQPGEQEIYASVTAVFKIK